VHVNQTVSKAIEQYASAIESLFMVETTPSERDSGHEKDERTSAWLTRARALYQEKKLEAFMFKPTVSIFQQIPYTAVKPYPYPPPVMHQA